MLTPFKVKITLRDYPKISFEGKVDLVNNLADTDTSTLLMRSIVNNPQKLLLPGLYVNVRVFVGTNPQAILIPEGIVQDNQGREFVYLVGPDNKVIEKTVTSGTNYHNQVEIKSGLKVGDKVIVSNLQKLRSGIVVNPTPASTH